MSKLVLRDYQQEAFCAVTDALDWGYASVLVTAATGTGKTCTFASLVRYFVREEGKRVLILAPRRELIGQAYIKIRDMCDLQEEYNEIDKEMGAIRFDHCAKVVVGCINTCYKVTRLQNWTPDYIIYDECHYVNPNAGMWKELSERFPLAVRIGFTATAMRGDRQPVFHEHIDGSKTRVKEAGKERDSTPEECGFFRHVYDYPLEDAVNDGWLVEPRGYTVKSDVDISGVKSVRGTVADGDFSQRELNAALEPDDKTVVDRINLAISKWKEVASDRPTVVFCPSVKYAHWAAQLWQQAGYTAAAIDCETEEAVRDGHMREIKTGQVQVTCNYGIYTHGTDVPEWSCIVLLRPTESTGLLSQMIGRVTRPADSIARLLGTLPSREERLALIAASEKPSALVIDVVDIVGKHELATLPTIIGLPAKIDLQGHTVTEAAELVREFEKAKTLTTFECPATFEELQAALVRIDILSSLGGKTRGNWLLRQDGSYVHGHTPPGYAAILTPEGDTWSLAVASTLTGEVLFGKKAAGVRDIEKYFLSAEEATYRHIERHKEANPKAGKSKGTLEWIRGWKWGGRGPIKDLIAAGFDLEGIDCLSNNQVFAILNPIWNARKRGKSA